MSLSDSTVGNLRPTRSRMWRSPVCLSGSSLHHGGVQICFGLKRAGNLTQLGSAAYASLMAPGETGWLWNCCQETQVYQGQIRTRFSLEQIQILDQRDLRVLPEAPPRSREPASLKVGQMMLTVSEHLQTAVCDWTQIWISKVPLKAKRVGTLY